MSPTTDNNDRETKQNDEPSKETIFKIIAPPGKIGIALLTTAKHGDVICQVVGVTSPLYRIVLPGDKLLELDGSSVRHWTKIRLSKHFAASAGQERVLTILRTHNAKPTDATSDNPHQGQDSNNNSRPNEEETPNSATNHKRPRNTYVEGDDATRKGFPLMSHYGFTLAEENDGGKASFIRTNLLAELVRWNNRENKKLDIHHTCRLLQFPLGYRLATKKPDRDKQMERIKNCMNRRKLYEDMLYCFSRYCECTEEEARELLFEFFARQAPDVYMKHTESAKEEQRKALRGHPRALSVLPDDYVNHDGQHNSNWNILYAQLIEYKQKHGHCLVPIKVDPLGVWVAKQRQAYKKKLSFMTPKRIELLENLGFAWKACPDRIFKPGGCPRFNKACAAKLVYPQLGYREALYLGGHTDEEMDTPNDKKHSWRTRFSTLKDMLYSRVKGWGKSTLKREQNKRVQQLIDMLKSDEEDRFEKVFGEHAHLLEGFLKAAEESKNSVGPKRKRKRNCNNKQTCPPPKEETGESSASDDDDEETEDEEEELPPPVRKRPHIQHTERQRLPAPVRANQFERQNYNPYNDETTEPQRRKTRYSALHGVHNIESTHQRSASHAPQQPQTNAANARGAAVTGIQFADANQHHDHHNNSQLDQLLWRLGQWS